MRLDPVFDGFYVLGTLWGGLAGPPVCPARPEAMPRAAVTAFVDVNVIPMDQERVLANHTVLVKGGRITALGPASQVKVPAGAVRIDGRGKYLLPGLVDMHLHLWGDLGGRDGRGRVSVMQDSLFRALAEGVTAARFIGGWYQDRQWYRNSWRPEVPTPHIYWPSRLPINPAIRADTAARWVAAAKAAGYDFIMMPYYVGPHPTDPNSAQREITRAPSVAELVTVDSILAAARRVGLPVAIHDTPYPLAKVLALGSAGGSYEHAMSGIAEGLWPNYEERKKQNLSPLLEPPLPEPSAATMQQVAATLQRAGVWVTPTLQCDAPDQSGGTLDQLVKVLQEAGVKLLLSGDDGWSVHDELAALVRAGLTPYQALRTGTYHPAEYFRKLDSVGTVAVGKRADLVLLYGNPLQDIRHAREPAGVMLAGRWLERAELDRRLLAWQSSGLHHNGGGSPAKPHPWLVAALNNHGIAGRRAQGQLPTELQPLAALVDSLGAVPATDKAAYEPGMQRLAAALGVIRTSLKKPEQQARFDVVARVWLREHRRRGYQVTVPGVAPTP